MEGIKACFENGISPNDSYRNEPLIYELTSEYTRTSRFKFIPAVNPISYAMMGLLPQFHRNENQIYEVVEMLLQAAYGIEYKPVNIPNKYLHK